MMNLADSAVYKRRLERMLAEVPARHGPPSALFGPVEDDFWFWLLTEGRRTDPRLEQLLPSMPPEEMQILFTGHAGEATLNEAFGIYTLFKRLYEKTAGPLSGRRVLDFGCGWGRILRFFLKDVVPSNLWGFDCWDRAIEFCRQSNRWCQLQLIDPLPPVSATVGTFDLIYAFSVFSHLAEHAQDRWLTEFQRLLSPGGLLIATTYGRNFFAECDRFRAEGGLHPLLEVFKEFFPDAQRARTDYDQGRYCYSPLPEPHGPLNGDFFGVTCISRAYVLERWTDRFTFVDFLEDQPFDQNVIVVRKQASSH